MKMIFVVFVIEKNGKYHAVADTIRTGENLKSHIDRYNCKTCHLCETRKQADALALFWNRSYKENNTNLY